MAHFIVSLFFVCLLLLLGFALELSLRESWLRIIAALSDPRVVPKKQLRPAEWACSRLPGAA